MSIFLALCLLTTCGDDDGGTHQNNNWTPEWPLTEEHRGWQRADCAYCHSLQVVHGGQYHLGQCTECHGRNGGPPVPVGHDFDQCTDCHSDGPAPWPYQTHQGYEFLSPDGCRDCHR